MEVPAALGWRGDKFSNKSLLCCFTFHMISSLLYTAWLFLEAIKHFVGWLMEKVVIWNYFYETWESTLETEAGYSKSALDTRCELGSLMLENLVTRRLGVGQWCWVCVFWILLLYLNLEWFIWLFSQTRWICLFHVGVCYFYKLLQKNGTTLPRGGSRNFN